MINGKFYSFLILLIALNLFSCSLKKDYEYAQEMKKGSEKYVSKEYEQAEQHYNEALRIAKSENNLNDILVTLGYLGRTYSADDKNEKAEEIFKERIDLATKNNLDHSTLQETKYALTLFYLTKGKCQEALKSYENLKSIKNSPQTTGEEKQAEETLEGMIKLKGCS